MYSLMESDQSNWEKMIQSHLHFDIFVTGTKGKPHTNLRCVSIAANRHRVDRELHSWLWHINRVSYLTIGY